MTAFTAPIAEQIWDMKYRFKQADGTPNDVTVEDTWRRIARDLARVEKEPEVWEDRFYDALEDFKYLPVARQVKCTDLGYPARVSPAPQMWALACYHLRHGTRPRSWKQETGVS